ncbi:MAG: hypothetical protein CME59_12060 [Halioglobus sp.]|nr:hypothetical protein [Halioglobus sp.]
MNDLTSLPRASAPALVLALLVASAFFIILLRLGDFYWFHGDEWVFLTQRMSGSLFAPHNEHVATVPILIYRLLFHSVGFGSYTPYQVPVLCMHLLTAVLLWLIMRRSQVNAWIATALAAVFVYFGPGEENIIWAFQVGFTGALAMGLAQLLLANHPGGLSRRDVLGLLLGLVAILSAGFAPVLVAVTGAVTLLRRGLKVALFHTVPLAVVFLGWWLAVGPATISDPYGREAGVAEVLHFVVTGYSGVFTSLAPHQWLAALYALVLPAGLVVACAGRSPLAFARDAAMPLGLFGAGLVFLAVTGYGRWWLGEEAATQSRYLHLGAAMTLPALGVAVDALTRNWRAAVWLAVLLIIAAIPPNVDRFGKQALFHENYFHKRQQNFVSLAYSPYAQRVPPETRPDPLQLNVPIGWILQRRAEGTLPPLEPRANPLDPLLFGLAQLRADNPYDNCSVIREPLDLSLRRGDEFGVAEGPWTRPKPGWFANQSFTLRLLRNGKPVGRPQMRHPSSGGLFRVQVDALEVRLGLAGDTESFLLCLPDPPPQ